MAILGPANSESPDDKKIRDKALAGPGPEQVLNVELKMTFPMRQWSWGQTSRYVGGLDPVLHHHIMGSRPDPEK
jgi:hypothetical protein